jgi:hypothetical protein
MAMNPLPLHKQIDDTLERFEEIEQHLTELQQASSLRDWSWVESITHQLVQSVDTLKQRL